ncbi:UDP-3-O-acyl-N-acetylglucosamine deacetylase [Acidiphilium cryptum]|uniref:UDP-3-O-acyl-N-acetylglucosamine deacetylase n=1 Tax=Acidiphilium cryptum (strain JF-5) TaxID=349163 RepID=A5FVZ4_ACICJ|nr:UDP-3-O-acyl-N-acetylglucosamine deacetylase [Acidiphilium cryptum]ABQ29776.1 UDP-3-O-[3-hydroxymyristoyl] N-acetylglucosamine deacetylase [Acidiphilium cryptum JF-5]
MMYAAAQFHGHVAPGQDVPVPRRGLRAAISCRGVGLHGGQEVNLRFAAAEPGSGIRFRRTDLGVTIPARHDLVADTRLCTVLADPARPEARIGTVEHVMAALAGLGIDDALVEVDGPEIPILDGSAAEFVFLLNCSGIVETGLPRDIIEIRRPVRVSDGSAFAELRPAAQGEYGFSAALQIDFPARAIGRQALSLEITPESFAAELARARTFTMKQDIDRLREAGLALGGTLANAVVVDGDEVINPEGLRSPDEFVRHKLLDVVGDLALAGAAIRGRFVGARTGHRLNNLLLRALFADRANYRFAGVAEPDLAAVA